MEEKSLDYYLQAFNKLKRAPMRGYIAPHKPLLLLAISKLVENGIIESNRITLSDGLIDEFKNLWKVYIDDNSTQNDFMLAEGLVLKAEKKYPFKCSIENPFFHLQSEPFWKLIKSAQWKKRISYSIKNLREEYEYAEIDDELFILMKSTDSRNIIKRELKSII